MKKQAVIARKAGKAKIVRSQTAETAEKTVNVIPKQDYVFAIPDSLAPAAPTIPAQTTAQVTESA